MKMQSNGGASRVDGTMRKALSGEALSHLIGSIYDCALEPDRWPETLTRIREELDFANASLSLLTLPSGDVLLDTMSSADPIWIERAPQNREGVIEIWGGEEVLRLCRWPSRSSCRVYEIGRSGRTVATFRNGPGRTASTTFWRSVSCATRPRWDRSLSAVMYQREKSKTWRSRRRDC